MTMYENLFKLQQIVLEMIEYFLKKLLRSFIRLLIKYKSFYYP